MTAEEIVRALAAVDPDKALGYRECALCRYGLQHPTDHAENCPWVMAKAWVAERPVFDAADATWETVDLRTAQWVSVGEPCGDRHGSWVCDLPYFHDGFHAMHRDGYLYRLWPDNIT